MKKRILIVTASAVLVAGAACGSTPTASLEPASGSIRADEQAGSQPQDTTSQRVPNLFGSGN